MSRPLPPTHRADGPAVLFRGAAASSAPRTAALAVGSAIAASAVIGAGAGAAQADEATWDRVAQCESSGNWSIRTGNGFYGGLQFTRSTWTSFGGGEYASTAEQATKQQQIAVARRVLAVQGPNAWPVCSKKAGLTKQSGEADRNAQPAGSSAPAAAQPAPAQPAPQPAASSGSLAVDGVFGPRTARQLERWVGVRQDGSFTTSDVRALQQKVGARADGVIGPETTRKLRAAIGEGDNGARSFRTDRATVRALQQYLNTH